MALKDDTWSQLLGIFYYTQVLTAAITLILTYYLAHAIYCTSFHPLSKYPGPRLAAFSNLWWAYNSTSGRYPWIIASVLRKYGTTISALLSQLRKSDCKGDVVRIAPNELVFITPRAAKDIYLAQEKNFELFVQVGYDALDTGDNGITGEPDPVKHREIAKKLAPAFSTRNLRAKEATINKHFNFFINEMKSLGAGNEGIDMRSWSDWLALDLSADMTYSRDMGQMRDRKDSILLSTTPKLNLFVAVSQLTRKFRLFTVLQYLTIPPSIWFALPELIKLNTKDVRARIERRGKIDHLDYFEQLLPADKPVPDNNKAIFHLENVAAQVLLASWQPLANQFYSLILFLLKEPYVYTALAEEIRGKFVQYEEIDIEAVTSLKYLNGCVQEGLRLHQETTDGLPRVSPGAFVDKEYIPQGVTCQVSYFAAARSPQYFTDPLKFCPERWLPSGHPRFDSKYGNDDLKASKPFSQGLRGCPGGAIAVSLIRLFIARVLWEFDLEAVEGQEKLSFEDDFKFYAYWDRPSFWVRFKPAQRARNHSKSSQSSGVP